MKKIENFVRENRVWMSVLLFMLAVVTGGSAMASAVIGDEGPEANPADKVESEDPADPEVNDRLTPGDGAAGQDLTGTQASSTQLRKGGLIDDEWDSELTRFQPYRTPLLSIARQVARKVNVSNWTIKHGRVGGETLDGRTTAEITGGATITLSSSNFSGSLKPFYKGSTLFVPTVAGYKKGSKTDVDGGLMLFVTDNDGKNVTCMAVNGPLSGDAATDDLDCMTCPTIPAGTYICAGATAASESQLLVTPENYQPREEEFNVQKKLLNIVFTEDYLKVKKKQPIKVADLKADAIAKYNMRAERTYWLGIPSRFSVTHNDGSIEDVYTSKGLLWQVTNSYSVERGKLTLGDLIAISKLQHTTFSQSDISYAFCGRNFMEWLLNLDMGSNQRIISMNDVRELDLDFKQLKTTFGTTNFIYDQGLDLIGMEDACVVLDLKGATRYVKTNEKERTNDMSKGAGEIRDAKRIIHEEADGLALRGYNSIIVAPTETAFSLPGTQMRSSIVSSAKLPATPADGVVVALTADYEEGGKTYEAGNVYQYNGTSWIEYTGYTTAV